MDTSAIESNYTTAWDILDAGDKNEEIETKCERREFCTNDIAHGFYSNNPGGIWRSVHLIISDKIYVDECFFVPTLEDTSIEVQYINSSSRSAEVTVAYSLVHKTTGEYLCGGEVEHTTFATGEIHQLTFHTPTVTPRLWGPGTPNLYDLTFTIAEDRNVLDTYHEQVGFRTSSFDGQTFHEGRVWKGLHNTWKTLYVTGMCHRVSARCGQMRVNQTRWPPG